MSDHGELMPLEAQLIGLLTATWNHGDAQWTKRDAFIAAVRELSKNAERYCWLRSEEVTTDPRYYDFWQEFNAKLCREQKLDAAIDAAMSTP